MHIFVDESGHFQYHDEQAVIIIVAVKTNKPHILRKLVRRVRQAKLHRRERRISEIKSVIATDKYKQYFFRKFAEINDVEIHTIYLRMQDVPIDARKKSEGFIYLKLVRALLSASDVNQSPRTIVRMDKRGLRGISAESFLFALTEGFIGSFQRPHFFNAAFVESHEELGIQVADFVAHALYAKHAHGITVWYDYIKHVIKSEQDGAQII